MRHDGTIGRQSGRTVDGYLGEPADASPFLLSVSVPHAQPLQSTVIHHHRLDDRCDEFRYRAAIQSAS